MPSVKSKTLGKLFICRVSDVGHSANSAYKAHARVWLLPSHLTPHRSAPLRHGTAGRHHPSPPESHRSGRRRRSSAVPLRRSNNRGRGEARPPASAGAGNRNPSPPPLPSPPLRGAGGDTHAGLALRTARGRQYGARRLPARLAAQTQRVCAWLSRVVSFWGGVSVRSRGLCSAMPQ